MKKGSFDAIKKATKHRLRLRSSPDPLTFRSDNAAPVLPVSSHVPFENKNPVPLLRRTNGAGVKVNKDSSPSIENVMNCLAIQAVVSFLMEAG